jgi:hypothetical protein
MTETAPVAARPWWSRRASRVAGLVTVAILLVGAFLLWGPIGIGNGPLSVQMSATEGNVAQDPTPVGFILPMYNSGHREAVVDGVELIAGTHYPGPRLLHLGVVSTAICGGAWPARTTASGFVMIGCGGASHASLIGYAIPYIHGISPGYPAAAEVTGPRPGGCWVLTEVVVHYHVGVRHYTATDRYQLVVCAKNAAARMNAAMRAAGLAPG